MKRNNTVIAVTGGIGSGKSSVCEILKADGFCVLSCDGIYCELLKDSAYLAKIEQGLGACVSKDGELDRTKLSELVFSDGGKLKKLNEITHPAIMEEVFKRAYNKRLCFCEVPLLFENGYESLFDGVIVVFRDLEARINSVVLRDGLSRENVQKRINSQYDYNNCAFAEYYVIHNSGDFEALKDAVGAVLKKIKENFKIR